MLEDLMDAVSGLLSGAKADTLAGAISKTPLSKQKHQRKTNRPVPKTVSQTPKLTARRDRRGGEDPWDWKEEKPPWEY